jgi:outer membrane receptor for ferrienterochelin and colicins
MNLILLVLAFACLGSVQAQDIASSTKNGFRTIVDSEVVDSSAPKLKLYGQELGSVSVTARISSLSKVDITTPQILSKAQIQRSSSADMGQLLSRVNGLQVSQDPTLGANLSINGLGGQYVKVLIDGVPVLGRMNGFVDMNQLPLQNVERIEIVKGPMSILYGADAIGGVINIITGNNVKRPWSGSFNTYFDPTANYQTQASIQHRTQKLVFDFSAGRNFFDGWSPKDTSRHQLWKPRETYSATAAVKYNAKIGSIGWNVTYLNDWIYNLGATQITPYMAYAFDEYHTTIRLQNSLWADLRLKPRRQLWLRAYSNAYQRIKTTYRKDMVTLVKEVAADPSLQDTTIMHESALQFRFSGVSVDQKWSWMIGDELVAESARGKRVSAADKQYFNNGIFAAVIFQSNKTWRFSPMLRATQATDYGTASSPAFTIDYYLNARHHFNLQVAEAYRAPSIKERYLYFVDINHDVVGNPNLKAELAKTITLQYNWTGQFTHKDAIGVEMRAFAAQIANAITLTQDLNNPSVYSYFNMQQIRNAGAAANLDFSSAVFTTRFGVNYSKVQNKLSSETSLPWQSQWEWSNNTTVRVAKTGILMALDYKMTGKQFSFSSVNNTVETQVRPAFHWLDLSAGKAFHRGKFNIQIGCKNVMNVRSLTLAGSNSASIHNTGNTALIATGRTAFIRLVYNWQNK